MDDLRELYQQIILDHNKNPKNFRELEEATHTSEGYNPLCGDKVKLFLKVGNDQIEDIGFQGSGCAISKASASVMTTMVKNKSIEETKTLFRQFQNLITGKDSEVSLADMGKMAVFAGVKEFPVRVKCAALAWHTLVEAFESDDHVVTTE